MVLCATKEKKIFPFCPLTLMVSEFSQVQRSQYTGNLSKVLNMCPSTDPVPCSCLDPHSIRPSHANLFPHVSAAWHPPTSLLLCLPPVFSERVHTSGLPLLCDKSHPASWVYFLKVLNGVLEMLLDNRSSLNLGQLDGTPCIAADMQALAVFLDSFLSFLCNIWVVLKLYFWSGQCISESFHHFIIIINYGHDYFSFCWHSWVDLSHLISWVRLPWPQPTQAVTQNPWPVPRRDARVLPIGLKRGNHFPELLSHSAELSWVEKLSSVVPGSPSLMDRLSLGYYESKVLLPSHANRTTFEPGSRILHWK